MCAGAQALIAANFATAVVLSELADMQQSGRHVTAEAAVHRQICLYGHVFVLMHVRLGLLCAGQPPI
jgi:hypothetical protein